MSRAVRMGEAILTNGRTRTRCRATQRQVVSFRILPALSAPQPVSLPYASPNFPLLPRCCRPMASLAIFSTRNSRLGERGGDAAPPFCTCGPVWVTPSKSQPRTGHNARTRFETAKQRTEKPLTNTRESTSDRPRTRQGEALLYNKK